MSKIQTGLRLDEDIHNKLMTLSKQESRSLNNLVEYIVKQYLSAYENEHGEIPVQDD